MCKQESRAEASDGVDSCEGEPMLAIVHDLTEAGAGEITSRL